MNVVDKIEQQQMKQDLPEFAVGDTVIVHQQVTEGNRTRTQAYEGCVLVIRNRGLNSSFIVRKISSGVGVEKTFQTHSPLIKKIEIKRRGDVRQAAIYYQRDRSGKKARIKEKLLVKDKKSASSAAAQ